LLIILFYYNNLLKIIQFKTMKITKKLGLYLNFDLQKIYLKPIYPENHIIIKIRLGYKFFSKKTAKYDVSAKPKSKTNSL